MLTKTMLKALHAWYRGDKWVKALYDAIDSDMTGVDGKLMQDYYNLFFDKLDEDGCKALEKDSGTDTCKRCHTGNAQERYSNKLAGKAICIHAGYPADL